MNQSPHPWHQAIRKAAQLVRQARRGVVLTGAGVSTSSGIPDFRSQDSGLWQRYDPRQVASLSAFRYHPESIYGFLREIAAGIGHAQPNPAHYAFAELEAAGFITTIITQNVDNLHQLAGSQVVLEVHGSMRTLTCVQCYTRYSSDGLLEVFIQDGAIPHCPECGGILKPDVILFEEQLPILTWQKAQEACRQADLILVAGTSLEVMPVAGLPMLAIQNGAPLILVNETATYLDVRAEVLLQGNVAELLPLVAYEALRE